MSAYRWRCRCPDCGAEYRGRDSDGGHCRGGEFGGCCRTFTSDAAAAQHRRDGACVDVGSDWRVRRDGTRYRVPWRETPRGWTPFEEREFPRVPVRAVEPSLGPGGTSTRTASGNAGMGAVREREGAS